MPRGETIIMDRSKMIDLRVSRGLSQADLEAASHISIRTINKIEKPHPVHIATIKRLAEFYGIVYAEFLDRFRAPYSIRQRSANVAPIHIEDDIRVSIAALARFELNEEFLLVRNEIRQTEFGALGGVIKIYPSAWTFLTSIGWEPEFPQGDPRHDDLRGYIKANQLELFKDWLGCGEDRETFSECLKRELQEELSSVAKLSKSDVEEALRIEFDPQMQRVVEEDPHGPLKSRSHPDPYFQYRYFEFFSPIRADQQLVRRLFEFARRKANLLIATRPELIDLLAARARKIQLSGPVRYYFDDDFHGHEAIPLTSFTL